MGLKLNPCLSTNPVQNDNGQTARDVCLLMLPATPLMFLIVWRRVDCRGENNADLKNSVGYGPGQKIDRDRYLSGQLTRSDQSVN